jgi:hypothetical protein
VSEKPLHVEVAEALGYEVKFNVDPAGSMDSWEMRECVQWVLVPRYDLDWSATGPLIEKYGICQYLNCGAWHSYTASDGDDCGDGATPLESLCRLILALGKAGKL